MLWVDKYRPKALERLDFHQHVTDCLRPLAQSGDLPHIFIYGPSGAGKKTRVMALLRELYGPGVEKLRVERRNFKPAATVIEITSIASNYHIELNPSDAGFHDRTVVQEIVKEIAQSPPIESAGGKRTFKVVVLDEVDKLTKEAQHGLRRTMEKYMSSCRMILVGQSPCKLIEPLRSRCLPVRVPAPSHDEITAVLGTIAAKEGLQLPAAFALRLATAAGRNLRRAILMLEASRMQQYPFVENQEIAEPDWEKFVSEIVNRDILTEQSPRSLLAIRGKLYELLSNCIPGEVILKQLSLTLMKKLDSELKHEVTRWAAYYEHRMQQGSKAIFHLEAFVARFMSLYKRWEIALANSYGDIMDFE